MNKLIPVSPKWLIESEAMKYCGMKRRQFLANVAKHGLKVSQPGKSRYYLISELDSIFERNTLKTA